MSIEQGNQKRNSSKWFLEPAKKIQIVDIPAPIQLRQEQVPAIVKAVKPLMREKPVKTFRDCFLLKGFHYSINGKNSTSDMKINALTFAHHMLNANNHMLNAKCFTQIPILVTLNVNSIFDHFYIIATEAVPVLQQLGKVIRPMDEQINFNFTLVVPALYNCTLQKLRSPEVGQEEKERIIAVQILDPPYIGSISRAAREIVFSSINYGRLCGP